MKKLIIMLIMAAGVTAEAGWTSGGGELLKDAHNPWFLNNVTEVKYCIKIDEKNFGQNYNQVSVFVRRSLEFWQRNFKTTNSVFIGGQVILAQQNFVEAKCDPQIDLVFQFGVLDGQQFNYFKDPTQFVAATTRTQYDRINMRGKGFIYVSPEDGPLALSSKNTLSHPWSGQDGMLLVPVLIHELAHIFGIQHNNLISFMQEDFPERLISTSQYNYEKNLWEGLVKNNFDKKMNVFKFERSWPSRVTLCYKSSSNSDSEQGYVIKNTNYSSSRVNEFLNINQVQGCRSLRIENDRLNVYSGPNEQNLTLIGSADLEKFESLFKQESITQLYLPNEQKVFNLNGLENTRQHLTFMQTQTDFKGLYKSVDGAIQRQVTLSVTPLGSISIGGEIDGKIYLDLDAGF